MYVYIQGTLSSGWHGVRNLGRKPQQSCLTVNVGCARLPCNDCTHTGWTDTWTTMLKGSENGYPGGLP